MLPSHQSYKQSVIAASRPCGLTTPQQATPRGERQRGCGDSECVAAGGYQSLSAGRQREGSNSCALVIGPFVQDLSAPYVPDDDGPVRGGGHDPRAVMRDDDACHLIFVAEQVWRVFFGCSR